MNRKKIGAIILLVLIAGLYLATIVFTFMDSPLAKSCLMAALFCTIVLPAVAYAFLMITRQIQHKAKQANDNEDFE